MTPCESGYGIPYASFHTGALSRPVGMPAPFWNSSYFPVAVFPQCPYPLNEINGYPCVRAPLSRPYPTTQPTLAEIYLRLPPQDLLMRIKGSTQHCEACPALSMAPAGVDFSSERRGSYGQRHNSAAQLRPAQAHTTEGQSSFWNHYPKECSKVEELCPSAGSAHMNSGVEVVSRRNMLLNVPTLKFEGSVDPEKDAKALHDCLRSGGKGVEKEVIIGIVSRRASQQRESIKTAYNSLYKENLITKLKAVLRGSFEEVIVSLLHCGPELDSYIVRKAVKGASINAPALIDITCTRSNKQLELVRQYYRRMWKSEITADIAKATKGPFQKLLVSLFEVTRSSDNSINQTLVVRDLTRLMSRVERLSTFASAAAAVAAAPSTSCVSSWTASLQEDEYLEIFGGRSFQHLRVVFSKYEELTGGLFARAIESAKTGDYERALLAIHNFVLDPVRYLAKGIREAMTKQSSSQIIRICVPRCEIDLGNVMQEYELMYKSSIWEDLNRTYNSNHQDMLKVLFSIMGRG